MSKHTCCQTIYGDIWSRHGKTCGRTAAYEHEGQHYCKTHHPPTIKAKRDAAQAERQADHEYRRNLANKGAAEAAEQKRRAECFPDLLEACKAIVEYQRLIESGASDGLIHAYGLAFESAAEAVAKATGEQQ